MNAINSSAQNAVNARDLNRPSEALGRSLQRFAAEAKLNDRGEASVAATSKFDARGAAVRATTDGVQNAVSRLQATERRLEAFSGGISRLGELAAQSNDGGKNSFDLAQIRREFTAVQERLREGVDADFGGQDLFGPSTGPAVSLDADGVETTFLPATPLRGGAFGELVRKDASGKFGVTLNSEDLGVRLAAAGTEVDGARTALGEVRPLLGRAIGRLQIEGENLASALPRLEDPAAAEAATRFARFDIAGSAEASLRAQANVSAQSVFRVLQG